MLVVHLLLPGVRRGSGVLRIRNITLVLLVLALDIRILGLLGL